MLRALLFSSALFFSLSTSAAQNVLTPEVDTFIEGTLASWFSSGGVGVAVVRQLEDGTWNVETKGYGNRGDGNNVTADTLFAMGSSSKLFGALTTGLLIANESVTPRITLDTKIADIIPGWQLADPVASEQATIVDLASHRTGLPGHLLSYTKEDNVTSIIERLRYLKPSAGFRETFQYSNIFYGVLSHLTEVLSTNMKFARYAKQHLFDPLGMSSTTFSYQVAKSSGNLASGVGRDNLSLADLGSAIPRAMPFWANDTEDGSYMSGAGGMISNAKDTAVFLQTLLLNGQNPSTGETIIPAGVIDAVTTGITVAEDMNIIKALGPPEVKSLFSPTVYGAGQTTSTYRGHVVIQHGGDVPGFHSQVSRLPYDKLGVAVLLNDNEFGAYMRDVLVYGIIDRALGLEPVDLTTPTQKALISGAKQPTSRPSDAPEPSVGTISSLVGEYKAPGYGSSLKLCAFIPNEQPTEECQAMVAGKPIVDPTIPTLLAEISSPLATHISLRHFSGNYFNLTSLYVLPTGDESRPFWASSTGNPRLAEFAMDESGVVGFGITGNFWTAGGSAGTREPVGDTVKDRAEVYYSRS
ncbi:beta-lactamase [Moniliophthora roreri MCA 2997]|uniref:Beta-lactamase n=1 Tax=Moniliophthora roreri (strain MCA 2997) TaxID=1381753 RepID=V2X0Y2_MONRO|nr:beta-lactamase [Moniliophthora roreri MCA 2997]